MNDIEVLEEFIKLDRNIRNNKVDSDYDEFCERRCIAIENLLKERQSDKERIKDLTLNEKEKEIIETYRNLIKETGLESWIICNPETMWCNYFIPKSLIKEKIEELDYKGEHYIFNEKDNAVRLGKIQVLEELLEGE